MYKRQTQELRAESAEALKAIGFDGYAVGGLAVGEGQEAMFSVLDYAPGMLPHDKPRYLMGAVSYTHLDVYKRQGLCGASVLTGAARSATVAGGRIGCEIQPQWQRRVDRAEEQP